MTGSPATAEVPCIAAYNRRFIGSGVDPCVFRPITPGEVNQSFCASLVSDVLNEVAIIRRMLDAWVSEVDDTPVAIYRLGTLIGLGPTSMASGATSRIFVHAADHG